MEIPLKTRIELELVHRDRDGRIVEIIKIDGDTDKNDNGSE